MIRYEQPWIENLLDGASRFGGADARALLTEVGVAAGSHVVDYGCGPGYFTLIAAELVGERGRVYAVDLEPRMVELVGTRAIAAGYGNCEALLSDDGRAPVADGAADVVLCVQIMHYAETRAGRVRGGARRQPPAQAGRTSAGDPVATQARGDRYHLPQPGRNSAQRWPCPGAGRAT